MWCCTTGWRSDHANPRPRLHRVITRHPRRCCNRDRGVAASGCPLDGVRVRAISLWQPWASLWLSPRKIHETRHWPTDYRGHLVVHAAKKLVSECGEEVDEICIAEFGSMWRRTLPRGALIGIVDLVSMIRSEEFAPACRPDASNIICGDWSHGRWGWQRDDNYQRFDTPIPYKGQQGFFSVPDGLFNGVAA